LDYDGNIAQGERNIKLIVQKNFPNSIPKFYVYDYPEHIEHIYQDGNVCLATIGEIIYFLNENLSLIAFIEKFVNAFIYTLDWFEKYKTYPFGDRKHGYKGLLDYYSNDLRLTKNRDVKRAVEFYNLDAIISVGYRVNSYKATKFRIWATAVLKEYMKKGFVLDDERLKQGKTLFKKDYFKELLERVRSIRTSERRVWQQITDIFAECSIDYNKNAQITKDFYAMVQNKFHYAITGKSSQAKKNL